VRVGELLILVVDADSSAVFLASSLVQSAASLRSWHLERWSWQLSAVKAAEHEESVAIEEAAVLAESLD
jgi:hypothetical protein